MSDIVVVENLSKSFKNIIAVNDLSFTVKKGDIFGFLGQNGAGKSTTMRMILGLVKPSKGSIRVFGKEITNNRKYILQQTGAMIERADFYKYLSAYQNLSIFAKLSGTDSSKKYLLKHLATVGLENRADDLVGGFSQGMKQRLAIAIALVHNPQLVILDEPTNGLDPQGISDIRNLIKGLSQEHNKTVIVSSHLLSEIEQIANRILIVDKGKKVVEGFTEQLISPKENLVYIQTDNAENGKKIVEDLFKITSNIASNELLEVKIDRDKIPLLINSLVNNGINIYAVKQQNNLENYFLSLNKNNHV